MAYGGSTMKSNWKMAALVEEYIAHRHSMGFRVTDDKDGGVLRSFGRYADQVKHQGPISTALLIQWATRTGYNASIRSARRLALARGFAQYRRLFDPDTEIPPIGILGSSRYLRSEPHIYSDQEISALQEAAAKIRPRHGLRPRTYVALFGMLACSGMRVSEALCMNDADVDLDQRLVTIRWGKFGKSRLLPIHPSTVRALHEYRQSRDHHLAGTVSSAFFVNEDGSRLLYHQVRHAFMRIRLKLGWASARRGRLPRIHDLRHTFAVRFLLRCYQTGGNVDQKIADLATYLGHVNVTKTYWYLTGVPELMAVVGDRLECFSLTPLGGGK